MAKKMHSVEVAPWPTLFPQKCRRASPYLETIREGRSEGHEETSFLRLNLSFFFQIIFHFPHALPHWLLLFKKKKISFDDSSPWLQIVMRLDECLSIIRQALVCVMICSNSETALFLCGSVCGVILLFLASDDVSSIHHLFNFMVF